MVTIVVVVVVELCSAGVGVVNAAYLDWESGCGQPTGFNDAP